MYYILYCNYILSWEVEEEDRAVRKSRLDRLLDQVGEVENEFLNIDVLSFCFKLAIHNFKLLFVINETWWINSWLFLFARLQPHINIRGIYFFNKNKTFCDHMISFIIALLSFDHPGPESKLWRASCQNGSRPQVHVDLFLLLLYGLF